MEFRNIDKIKFIVKDATGLDVMYAYDDLVFPEHAAFIIQFDNSNEDNFFCYFHEDCNDTDKDKIFESLKLSCKNNNSTITSKGWFNLKQKDQEIEINFLKECV